MCYDTAQVIWISVSLGSVTAETGPKLIIHFTFVIIANYSNKDFEIGIRDREIYQGLVYLYHAFSFQEEFIKTESLMMSSSRNSVADTLPKCLHFSIFE
jgi:hypothetical protein